MNRRIGTLAPAALSLLLAACGGGGPAADTSAAVGGASGTELAEQQVLHVGNGAELQSLDPHRAEDIPSFNVHRDIYEGLVSESPKGELIPGVATDWTISEDGQDVRVQPAPRSALVERRSAHRARLRASRCAAASIRRRSAFTATSLIAAHERRRHHGRQTPA